jgi:Fur family peroxide stress response transcriptional regulator
MQMTLSKPDIKDLLRERGYRVTPQRLAIYDAVWNAGSHPTASEVYELAEQRDPTMSKATVYKALQLFTELGLVREIGFRDDSTRYDPDTEFHINLVCTSCGKIEDYHCVDFDDIAPNLKGDTGFEAQSHHFEIYGLCVRCSKERI